MVVLYPLGVTLDFWDEITYYQRWWQTINTCKVFLSITFIGGHAGTFNNSIMLTWFSRFPRGFDSFECNVRVMDNPSYSWTRDVKCPSWVIHSGFIMWSCTIMGNVVKTSGINQTLYSLGLAHLPSPNPQVLVELGHGPTSLWPLYSKVIQWHILEDGIWIYLVEFFRSINSDLVAFLQFGIKVCVILLFGEEYSNPTNFHAPYYDVVTTC
jgi:hypothetical protein